MKIGVFDSGVGGLAVVEAINNSMPHLDVIYRDDKKHVPYGDKDINLIYSFVLPILITMQKDGCELIVIACNTVTTNLIGRLRGELNIPLLGMEPMVKPATKLTKTGVIGVCATPKTLQSARYRWLKKSYANGIKVIEPDCSNWSYLIENNRLDTDKIQATVDEMLKKEVDVIVLGCTHYHWIEREIKEITKDRAQVLQPEEAVIKQLKKVIESLD